MLGGDWLGHCAERNRFIKKCFFTQKATITTIREFKVLVSGSQEAKSWFNLGNAFQYLHQLEESKKAFMNARKLFKQ